MKKFLSALLLSFVATTINAADPALSFQGTGSEADPYRIGNAAELQELALACAGTTAGTTGHYDGVHFILTDDIDMAGVTDFIGIASAPYSQASSNNYYFAGVFDGKGHRIKNLEIKSVAFDSDGNPIKKWGAGQSRKWVGLFGNLMGVEAVVRNVIIDESCRFEALTFVGGIAGEVSNDARIENCSNYGAIVCYDQVAGGIAGALTGTKSDVSAAIEKCLNAGAITTYTKQAGGIAGKSTWGTVSECANIGNISSTSPDPEARSYTQTEAGGIIGSAQATTISDCLNAGLILADKERAGGIAGYMTLNSDKGEIKSCVNTGTVLGHASYQCGPVLGATSNDAKSMMTAFSNCYYDGQLLDSPFMATANLLPKSDGVVAVATAELTSGNALEGLGAAWQLSAGYYPVVKALASELSAAASTYIQLPQGQTAAHFSGQATISGTMPGISASLDETSELFTVNGNTISASPDKGMGSAWISLTNGNYTRRLCLTTYKIALEGNGTEASPYQIKNKNDLEHFAQLTIVPRAHFANTYFALTADIDMQNDASFRGIAAGSDPAFNSSTQYFWHFDGIFDGCGHSLRNLNLRTVCFDAAGNATTWAGGSFQSSGLFGALGAGAVVKNLTIDSGSFMDAGGQVGGITGSLAGGPVLIENCHVAAHIKAYSRYTGGIFGYSATAPGMFPLTIKDCTFSGLIESNWDYVGGIAGWAGHADSRIIGCANTGTIKLHHFSDYIKPSQALSRVGGITGVNNGTVEGCASYGPIIVEPAAECPKVEVMGGLAGQSSNLGKYAAMECNFSASQLYITGANEALNNGALLGQQFHAPASPQGPVRANYCDLQLNAQSTAVGSLNPDNLPADPFIGLDTSELTSGNPIEELAEHFSFENGYYPMPKKLATRPEVRAAAATFLTFPAGQSIRDITDNISAPFNSAMPLTGTLADGTVFHIENNTLITDKEAGSDLLTLTNGQFSTIYPLVKGETSGIGSVEIHDPVVDTVYYSLSGCAIDLPAPGTTVIAVSTTASGRCIATKTVIR